MKILKCSSCCVYTLESSCPICKSKVVSPRPPRFSMEDHYGSQRRKMKKEAGLI